MHAINVVANALPVIEPPEATEPGMCCVTGLWCDQTIPRDWAIKPSFTNRDLLKAPCSDRVGVNAWRTLTYAEKNPGKSRDRRPLAQSSWACDGDTIWWLDRKKVRDLVLEPPRDKKPWVLYATTSYQKHGVLSAPVNLAGKRVWLFETLPVDCSDPRQVETMWEKLRDARLAGVRRSEIEVGTIDPHRLKKLGWSTMFEFLRWAESRAHSPLYRFLTYLLPSEEEIECASLKNS
jgi:hypothetical protein